MLISRKCLGHITTALVAASQWLLFPGSANAASDITISSYVERDPDSSRHDLQDWPYAVSQKDCENDVITTLSVTLPEKGDIQVWAGSSGDNCNDPNDRSTNGCWELLTEYADETRAYKIDIHSQALAGGDCASDRSEQLTVFIALVSGEEVIASGTWETLVDLRGPNPPTGVEAGIGENRLELSWNTPSGESVSEFRYYCALPSETPTDSGTAGSSGTGASAIVLKANGGTSGGGGTSSTDGTGGTRADAAGAGTAGAGTAGAGAGGTSETAGSTNTDSNTSGTTNDSTASCYSADLVEGESPGEGAWECGSAFSGTAVNGRTDRLDNNRVYAVAVASVDLVGNVSVLSAPACQAPQELTDFYEAYKAADGRGGGGTCSVSAVHRNPAIAVGGALALLGLVARRLRRGSRRAR